MPGGDPHQPNNYNVHSCHNRGPCIISHSIVSGRLKRLRRETVEICFFVVPNDMVVNGALACEDYSDAAPSLPMAGKTTFMHHTTNFFTPLSLHTLITPSLLNCTLSWTHTTRWISLSNLRPFRRINQRLGQSASVPILFVEIKEPRKVALKSAREAADN